MLGLRDGDDCRPLTWVGRLPVYLTTVLTALYAFSTIAVTIALSAGVSVVPLIFYPSSFLGGQVWQIFTYSFVEKVTFFTPLNLFFLFFAGQQVESYLGRRRFLGLLFLTVIVPVAVDLLWYWHGRLWGMSGSFFISVGLFMGFAALYPNTDWFGFIPMKWVALIGFVLAAMSYVGDHDWPGLSALIAVCAASLTYVRLLQFGGFVFLREAIVEKLRPKPKFVLPIPRPPVPRPRLERTEDVMDSIDPLLEKISKHGIESLTPAERQRLERARLELLKKG